jgi:hypothetical protein
VCFVELDHDVAWDTPEEVADPLNSNRTNLLGLGFGVGVIGSPVGVASGARR